MSPRSTSTTPARSSWQKSWIRPERSTRSRKTSFPMSRRASTRPATRIVPSPVWPASSGSAAASTAATSSPVGKALGQVPLMAASLEALFEEHALCAFRAGDADPDMLARHREPLREEAKLDRYDDLVGLRVDPRHGAVAIVRRPRPRHHRLRCPMGPFPTLMIAGHAPCVDRRARQVAVLRPSLPRRSRSRKPDLAGRFQPRSPSFHRPRRRSAAARSRRRVQPTLLRRRSRPEAETPCRPIDTSSRAAASAAASARRQAG